MYVERTRQRTIHALGSSNRKGFLTQPPLATQEHEFDPLPLEYVRRAEHFQDITGSKGEFHPCSHTYFAMSPGTVEPFVDENWGIYPSITSYIGEFVPLQLTGDINVLSQIGPYDLNAVGGFLPGEVAEDFTRDAFFKCIDLMPEEVSITNFVLELSDLEAMCRNIAQVLNLPGQFLNWNFGWLPLIQDLKAFISLAKNVNDRLKHLRKINKRWVTMTHHRRYTEEDNSPFSGPLGDPEYNVAPSFGMTVPRYDVDVSIRIGCYYDLDLGGWDTLLRAFCAALGIDNVTKIVWNAIPFSFVVDWIANISEFLDQTQSAQAFKGTLVIGGVSCSYKTRYEIQLWTKSRKPLLGPDQYARAGSALVWGYHRRLGAPTGTFEMSGLSPRQQQLALALLSVRSWEGLLTRRRRRFR